MSKLKKFLEIAQKEVGYVEGPKSNETKYGAFTGHNFQPWCGSFIMWVAAQSNVKLPNLVWTPGGAEAFKGKGQWSSAEAAKPQPGDIVFFDFVKGGAAVEHVGIVLRDNQDGTITTIEGNTSPEKKKGSQANGGEVCIRTRAYKVSNRPKLPVNVVGFGKPKWIRA